MTHRSSIFNFRTLRATFLPSGAVMAAVVLIATIYAFAGLPPEPNGPPAIHPLICWRITIDSAWPRTGPRFG